MYTKSISKLLLNRDNGWHGELSLTFQVSLSEFVIKNNMAENKGPFDRFRRKNKIARMLVVKKKKADFQEALTASPIIIKLFNTANGKVSNLAYI